MRQYIVCGILVALCVGLVGCPRSFQRVSAPADGQASEETKPRTAEEHGDVGADTYGATHTEEVDVSQLGNGQGVISQSLGQRTVYFDLNSNAVDPAYFPLIEAHAGYLSEHPEQQVLLQGHTDERGSREYNLALGERRARAVFDRFLLLGVVRDQMRIASSGEEQPTADGHDEASWMKNRRVEIVY